MSWHLWGRLEAQRASITKKGMMLWTMIMPTEPVVSLRRWKTTLLAYHALKKQRAKLCCNYSISFLSITMTWDCTKQTLLSVSCDSWEVYALKMVVKDSGKCILHVNLSRNKGTEVIEFKSQMSSCKPFCENSQIKSVQLLCCKSLLLSLLLCTAAVTIPSSIKVISFIPSKTGEGAMLFDFPRLVKR